jgi:hypothetical protein
MNDYQLGRGKFERLRNERDTAGLVILLGFGIVLLIYSIVIQLHIRKMQFAEGAAYLGCILIGTWQTCRYHLTFRKRRRETWPQAEVEVPLLRYYRDVHEAFRRKCVVLGYTVENQRWYWSDDIRRMQALLLGMSGSGKTTLLLSILAQDLRRTVNGRHIPIIIIDCKADTDFRKAIQSQMAAAGRSHQFYFLDPTQPEISAHWNPFCMRADSYYEHINFIFEAFGLKKDFFKGHQYTYFGDLVRVLYYTGMSFNAYDVLVMAQDQKVLEEQIDMAAARVERLYSPHDQHRLNFEMSVHNLMQSFDTKERIEKIQGLLNELMTFIQDDLSIVAGSYENLISLEDVIEKELVLYISLNVGLDTKAVTTLGKMLLHNLKTISGRRYQEDKDHPFVSVIMDEFSPMSFPEFSHIIQTARGSNIGILFSLQGVSQLENKVGVAFCKEVISAPNTVMVLRCTQADETAKYFISSASLVEGKRRTMTVEQTSGILGEDTREIGFGSETYIKEPRAKDEQIRNLPRGQFQMLVANPVTGTDFAHLHVRPAPGFTLECFEPVTFPTIRVHNFYTEGANLRFKDPGVIERRVRYKGRRNQTR